MPRFKETGGHSFFGQWLYQRIVPQDHFLVQLQQIIHWARLTQKLLPTTLLKMLLVSYLYNLSERQT